MYKLHLILKYLRKRRIAWVSLIAVMLCTAMVLVVISVMGGWLRMFRESFHGLSGDILVQATSLEGFPHYQAMIDEIEKLPQVEAAVPTIRTFGLININNRKRDGVQVLGFDIDRIGKVHRFPESLWLQHNKWMEMAEDKTTDFSPADRKALREKAEYLAKRPSFSLHTPAQAPLEKLPDGLELPEYPLVRYDADSKRLSSMTALLPAERDRLLALSNDPAYRRAVNALYLESYAGAVPYKALLPRARGIDPGKWPGLIAGAGVLNIRKDASGAVSGRFSGLYEIPVKLTLMDVNARSLVDAGAAHDWPFWIVDDSRTQIWQYDQSTVYVPFDVLQKYVGMDEQTETDAVSGKSSVKPARTNDLHVKLKPGADLDAMRDEVEKVVRSVASQRQIAQVIDVQTWEQSQAIWLGAIEKEKALVTFLFGMISIVAIFLIFCIFYMIVVEKTRDIGIIKSVGATNAGVAGIFLGYGLAIGLVGSLLGLLFGWLIVHNINELHAWMGRALHIQIWNPEVYAFDTIPNTMNPREVMVILGVAIVSSVLGALVPAIVASNKHPIEALRWE